ncbi:hypothetical protein GUITHDRAFT_159575 [Guillardia theta CCMP2712]|uniref:Major facilitator superfamily (MFS) profile domain-containing protein n=1 Tax=Guillardia theta (strain CCMP2712) TaxID=905079 RepID=L1JG31_GUITC|nr:hypothetical protein GUITHDRAFT_159575 [Guillardia theta CCMP2712]EKX47104.1 hypothetical protein GUITHDRAFT_159575 [Guillardia theta CCMP2712]|eukprot:XP_005834084.1 hypothetical protein GUITHDRAFT_159575 [Guillardia theta CCMP2712]
MQGLKRAAFLILAVVADSSHGFQFLGSPALRDPDDYVLYDDRWVQLGLLSLLALLSDWACFAAVGGPKTWVSSFHHNPDELIDLFLFSNVISCFLFTDVSRRFGLKKSVTWAAGLMTLGCALRSGLSFLPPFDRYDWVVPDYLFEITGTILIGIAQPFFQCSPPQLSATWFGSNERALATAVCLNANQLGIATAFVVGGTMLNGKVPEALDEYLTMITFASLAVFGGTVAWFKDRPPTPPTSSAARAAKEEDARQKALAEGKDVGPFFTYPQTALSLLSNKGFLPPLAAFVASIGVTNVVSAFTSETMHRAGFVREAIIDEIGAGFQVAIMLGGILLGRYVDRTKQYKGVTLACFGLTISTLSLLGIAEGYDMNLPGWVVVSSLIALGASAGPVQPINAELAVEVTYPSDENAVEATQQLCGNFFSALLVPICVTASQLDFKILPGIGPNEDVRGDTLVLIALASVVALIFSTFNAELKREALDSHHHHE